MRVLNLWQKNGVYDMDIIQPLLDMGNGSFVPAPSQAAAGKELFFGGQDFNELSLITNYCVKTINS